jgi:DNA primase catalytic subunit
MDKFYEFYSRKDVREAILKVCEDREVAPRYGEGFGKRPDVIQYPGDLLEMAKRGATSFHISEERWSDPLTLKPGITKKEFDENRIGWDLILDIDVPYWDYAKWTAYFLVEALKFHDVKNISAKFSGNKGLHIAVPFESFPSDVNGIKIKNLFPEGPRIITAYLQNMIQETLTNKILEKENITQICQRAGKKKDEITENGKFNPFKIIEIDTVLISSRHLFRAPYSMHEKSGLVSVPIDPEKILEFEKVHAEPQNITFKNKFLDKESFVKYDGKSLLIQAFDWWGKKNAKKGPDIILTKQEFKLPEDAIPEEFFPNCIKKILEGNMEDGKKRAVFILINFLKHMGWKYEDIEKKVIEWNTKNKSPLTPSYVLAQLSWHKKQKEAVLPPNCSNKSYYEDMRLGCGNCKNYKNPVNYAQHKYKIAKEGKKNTKASKNL